METEVYTALGEEGAEMLESIYLAHEGKGKEELDLSIGTDAQVGVTGPTISSWGRAGSFLTAQLWQLLHSLPMHHSPSTPAGSGTQVVCHCEQACHNTEASSSCRVTALRGNLDLLCSPSPFSPVYSHSLKS